MEFDKAKNEISIKQTASIWDFFGAGKQRAFKRKTPAEIMKLEEEAIEDAKTENYLRKQNKNK